MSKVCPEIRANIGNIDHNRRQVRDNTVNQFLCKFIAKERQMQQVVDNQSKIRESFLESNDHQRSDETEEEFHAHQLHKQVIILTADRKRKTTRNQRKINKALPDVMYGQRTRLCHHEEPYRMKDTNGGHQNLTSKRI